MTTDTTAPTAPITPAEVRDEVRWDPASQTHTATCGCGWRFHASTHRHAQVRGDEHVRDDHADPCPDPA